MVLPDVPEVPPATDPEPVVPTAVPDPPPLLPVELPPVVPLPVVPPPDDPLLEAVLPLELDPELEEPLPEAVLDDPLDVPLPEVLPDPLVLPLPRTPLTVPVTPLDPLPVVPDTDPAVLLVPLVEPVTPATVVPAVLVVLVAVDWVAATRSAAVIPPEAINSSSSLTSFGMSVSSTLSSGSGLSRSSGLTYSRFSRQIRSMTAFLKNRGEIQAFELSGAETWTMTDCVALVITLGRTSTLAFFTPTSVSIFSVAARTSSAVAPGRDARRAPSKHAFFTVLRTMFTRLNSTVANSSRNSTGVTSAISTVTAPRRFDVDWRTAFVCIRHRQRKEQSPLGHSSCEVVRRHCRGLIA